MIDVVNHESNFEQVLKRQLPGATATYADRIVGTQIIWVQQERQHLPVRVGDLDIPADIPVRIVGCGPMAVRLKYTGSRGYMFLIKAGWRAVTFENLVFDGGGIAYEGGVRRHQAVINCVFQDCANGPAIRCLGQSVIDVAITRCWFNRCAGGISVDPHNSDLWLIDHCAFNRNTDTDVVIGSSGVTLRDCRFEMRPTANADKPHIQITFGLCDVIRCSFGPDVEGSTFGPPKYPIVIGPLGGRGAGTIGGVRIEGCRFYGMNPYGPTAEAYPDDDQAKAAIHLSKGLFQSHIVNNYWRRYATAFIHEDYASASSRDNVATGNVKDSLINEDPEFSGDATGWN